MPQDQIPPMESGLLPSRPYVGLEPCGHAATFGGRAAEVEALAALLNGPGWVLAVHAPAGTGKTSLLQAGLIPHLVEQAGAAGRLLALDPWPARPGLEARLVSALAPADAAPADQRTLAACLQQLASTSPAPIILLDHLEGLFHGERSTLTTLAGLLTDTLPEGDAPAPCRWVLCFDDEALGKVEAWLSAVQAAAWQRLPPAWQERMPIRRWRLPVLGEAIPGLSPAQVALDSFQDAIGRAFGPQATKSSLKLWSKEASHVAELAQAFAAMRVAAPEEPLAPRLQWVLDALGAQAVREAGERLALRLPDGEDTRAAILSANAMGCLRRRMDEAFYRELPADQRRKRTLATILMASLLSPEGHPCWVEVATLRADLGEEGRSLLDRLCRDRIRLLLREESPGAAWLHLPHGDLAPILRDLLEDRAGRAIMDLDPALLEAWRVLGRQAAQGTDASGLTGRQVALLRTNQSSLPLNATARSAWEVTRTVRARATARTRWMFVGGLAAGLGVAVGVWAWMDHRMQARQEQELLAEVVGEIRLLSEVERGKRSMALFAMERLHDDFDYPARSLLEVLNRRPADERDALLAEGWSDMSRAQRTEACIKLIDLLHPFIWGEGWENDESLFGALLTGLERGASDLDGYDAARQRLIVSLRSRRPPPDVDLSDDESWSPLVAGTSTIGCQPAEAAAWTCGAELAPHQVELSPFHMQRTEVTVEEYRLFDDKKWPLAEGRYPVKGVNWYEAAAYAAWLGAELPTEAQWETAARAGSDTAFWSGNTEADLARVGWYAGNTVERPARVAGFQEPHPLGLWDIHGNMAEWCHDWYAPYDPTQRKDPQGPSQGQWRAARGGAWFFGPENARSSARFSFEPDYSSNFLGFRVVVPVEAGQGE